MLRDISGLGFHWSKSASRPQCNQLLNRMLNSRCSSSWGPFGLTKSAAGEPATCGAVRLLHPSGSQRLIK